MEKPKLTKEKIVPLFDSRFIKVFDLQYAEGRHYYNATRRSAEDLMAVKSDEEFQHALADAVSCIVIIENEEKGARLLLSYEYRYPAGQFLLSVPAGLVDPEDREKEQPLLETARREIREETGLEIGPQDRLFVVNPLLFSTPGMTDESNALVCAVLHSEGLAELSQEGAVGSECFDGFGIFSREEAMHILQNGVDPSGNFYSVYTWTALMYFVSGMWK